jgi:hypothetical protein
MRRQISSDDNNKGAENVGLVRPVAPVVNLEAVDRIRPLDSELSKRNSLKPPHLGYEF